MKIARSQLRQIIKEELRIFLVQRHSDVEPPTNSDAWHPGEVEPRDDAWSGGDNLEDSKDHAGFETGETNAGPHVVIGV